MKKAEAHSKACTFGQAAAFVADVVLNHHRNPARKLNGLVEILTDGREVRTGSFSIDTLLIDGRRFGWEILESPTLASAWIRFAVKGR